MPDSKTIKNMVDAYAKVEPHPGAYTLDIAVIKDDSGENNNKKNNKTVPLEIHPFVACGLYGFYERELLDMLEEGFMWYLKDFSK